GVPNAHYSLHLQIPELARARADQFRRDSKIGDRFVIFHPGSARKEKFWEPARWATVIEHASRNNDVDLVLTSGTSRLEQTHIAEIQSKMREPVVDLSGKTDLLTLAALIGQASILVKVDSVPIHISDTMQTP